MAARVRHQAPGTGLGPTNSTASKNTTTTVTFRQEPQSPRAHSRLANFRPQQAAPALRNKGAAAAAAAAVTTTTTTTSKEQMGGGQATGQIRAPSSRETRIEHHTPGTITGVIARDVPTRQASAQGAVLLQVHALSLPAWLGSS